MEDGNRVILELGVRKDDSRVRAFATYLTGAPSTLKLSTLLVVREKLGDFPSSDDPLLFSGDLGKG